VAQFVPQHRDADVARRIDLEGDAHVTVAAGGREELRRAGGAAEERSPPHEHDQIGRGETLQDGAKRGGLIAAAHDGFGHPRVVGPEKGRGQRFGARASAAGEQHHGGEPAPGERAEREPGRAVFVRIHDESPVRPQGGAARRTWCADNVVMDARGA